MISTIQRQGFMPFHRTVLVYGLEKTVLRPSVLTTSIRYTSSNPIVSNQKATNDEKGVISTEEGNARRIAVYSIPITTHRSFIYCDHAPSLLHKSQLASIPLLTKIENKVVGLATKGWIKISSSDLQVNKYITRLVKRLLNSIPFEEACLRSFPSKNTMIREINRQVTTNKNHKTSKLMQAEIEKLDIDPEQIKPIPLFHPEFQKPSVILKQLHEFGDFSYSKHIRSAALCAIGIPITLPLALLPVVPNVPGLYLAYRLYCHIKVLMGVKHLNYLLEKSQNTEVSQPGESKELEMNSTDHLVFRHLPAVDQIYREFHQGPSISGSPNTETLIMNDEIIERICDAINLPNIKDDLRKAVRQEQNRLSKNLNT